MDLVKIGNKVFWIFIGFTVLIFVFGFIYYNLVHSSLGWSLSDSIFYASTVQSLISVNLAGRILIHDHLVNREVVKYVQLVHIYVVFFFYIGVIVIFLE